MPLLYVIVALVALARTAELIHANRNTRALLARGGVEAGRGQYPLFVILHTAWLIALVALIPPDAPLVWPWLVLFVLLQFARVWVIASLGPYWTTRVITLPDAPLVRRGPYRFLRHPNYLVVAIEIPTLPLAFGAWPIALAFGLANLALLAWRIRIEDRTLAPRREELSPND